MQHSWLDKMEYPFRAHYMEVGRHKLHFIDEGRGEILLFVHGTPSWSFEFRKIIKTLRLEYRCMAPDHMGFGLSDKPKHYDYSTQNHSNTLEKFILEKDLSDITLVVHDFGGPIGLHFAIKYPEKIKRIVAFNSWLWSSEKDPDFLKMRKLLKSPVLPVLYRWFNFSPRYLLPKSFGDHKPSKALLKQYARPFARTSERNGVIAFARSLVDDQWWFEELWLKRSRITDKPALFIWGMKDPFIKPAYLDKFSAAFPFANVVQLDGCGHFPQEEQPEISTKSIVDFLRETKGPAP